MEGTGAIWVQIIASVGVITPLVLGILGFIERRSNQAKKAEASGSAPTVQAGLPVGASSESVSDVLRERVTALEQTIEWIAAERNYYYDKCLAAGVPVDPPRVRYVR